MSIIMGFLDTAKQSNQEVKEAANNKAQEYANLSAQIESLTSVISDLRATLKRLENNLTNAKTDIENIKTLGKSVIAPIKSGINSVSKELEEVEKSVRIASEKIKDTEYSYIDWQGRVIYAFFTAILFILIVSPIQYYIFDIGDIKKDIDFIKDRSVIIHYNQTTGSQYGQYDPWHINEFWRNYIDVNEKNKKK